MPAKEDFAVVFEKLKRIMQRREKRLAVAHDRPGNYSLNAGFSEKYKKDIFFGAVQVKKSYVSYHLMPVYMFPDLLHGLSPGLKRRMQGKSCFNFKSVDKELFDELAALTKRGFDRLKQAKLV